MNSATLLRHPLQHDGTSRRRRLIGALLPQHAPIDERGTADLLLYAEEYARLLQFHDLDGRTDGDWSGLFGRDASVLAALLLKREQAAAYEAQFRPWAEQLENQTGTADIRVPLRQILELMLRMAVRLTDWRAQAAEGLSLSADLDRLLRTVTGDGFYRLLAYLREASAQGVFAPGELPLDQYEAAWPLAVPAQGFAPLRAGLVLDADAAFRESRALRQVFNAFHGVYVQLLARAEAYLEETLTAYPAHEPHMALFLAFVQLLAEPRAQLNRLTKQHLDFYFRDVLRLSPKPAVFDQVHLVLELADGFTRGLLSAEDRIQDGTDPSGNDVFFRPNEELALTPALLDPEEGLKTLFLDKQALAGGAAGQYAVRNAYGSPDADGDARKSADGKWFPLGTPQDPAARFGFAIASPMFLLAEGEREVRVRFHLEDMPDKIRQHGLSKIAGELQRNVRIYASGQEEWIQIANVKVLLQTNDEASAILVYSLTLGPDMSAVVPYHTGLAGKAPIPDLLSTSQPVMCFLFDNQGLSVEGDIDLSLAGELDSKRFDPDRVYQSGEVVLDDTDPNSIKIYTSQGGSIGVLPSASGKYLWENVTAALGSAVSISFPYTGSLPQGSYIRFEAPSVPSAIYRANIKLNDPTVPPSAPAADQQIWKMLPGSKGSYNPEETYLDGDIVELGGQLHQANGPAIPIAPSWPASTQWAKVLSGTGLQSYQQNPVRFFRFGEDIYKLNAIQTTSPPNLSGSNPVQESIWEQLNAIEFSGGVFKVDEGDFVYNTADGKLYRLKSDNTSKERFTYSPPPTTPPTGPAAVPDVWTEIQAFVPGTTYSPDALDTAYVRYNQTVYKCNYELHPASRTTPAGTTISNEALRAPVLPGSPGAGVQKWKIWNRIDEYDLTIDYPAGTFIRKNTPSPQEFYYASIDIPAGIAPGTAGSGWVKIQDVPAASYGWNDAVSYAFGDIVREGGNDYGAAIANTNIDPNNSGENRLLWSGPQTLTDDPYSLDDTYAPGSLVRLNARLYVARYSSKNLSPEVPASGIWELVSAFDTSGYSGSTPYDVGAIIRRAQHRFFRATHKTQGNDPDMLPKLWEKEEIEGEFSGVISYAPGQIVIYKNDYYYSLFQISYFAPDYVAAGTPSNGNIWTDKGPVSTFDPTVPEYDAGDIVYFNDELFQAQFNHVNVHPALDLLIWEPVPAPIPSFEKTAVYPLGSYVQQNGDTYRACAGSQEKDPAAGIRVWEANSLNIKTYAAGDADSYHPETDYILYNGILYRLLRPAPSSEPGTDPLQWQPVGEIRFHNPNVEWYPNMHVRDAEGNVYRAKTQTPPGAIPLGAKLSDPDYWEKVSGSYPYKYLTDTYLASLELEVRVENMRNLILENDQGVINAGKPFHPFGSVPNANARFYIGNYEAFSKSLTEIKVHAEWGNLPADLSAYYANYKEPASSQTVGGVVPIIFLFGFVGNNSPVSANDYFTASAFLLEAYNWYATQVEEVNSSLERAFTLFTNSGETAYTNPITFKFQPRTFQRSPELPVFTSATPVPERGFLTFKLNQHFFHEIYPKILAQAALKTPPEPSKIPNPPYTPLINSLTLSYAASETLVFKDKTKGDFEDRIEQFFHLHPYGWAEFVPVDEALDDGQGVLATRELVPRYLAQAGNAAGSAGAFDAEGEALLRDAAGNLFIGIQDLQPPQVLTLLFQVAEGSENPARAKRFVSWSYLADNRWRRFEPAQILSDDTNGLLRPGIVKLSVPSRATGHNTLLPGGRFWLRASVTEDPDGIGFVYDVRIHAVKATFENSGNDLSRLASPLPAESLTGLFFSKAEIQQVAQPFASFGGSLEEQDEAFYIRVSERLRHKQRAVSVFDYERLVLAQFPQVYQVKCITHTEPLPAPAGTQTWNGAYLADLLSQGIEYRPGHVQVIVLPDLRNQNAIDPLRPRVSTSLRGEIRAFLQQLSSGFAELSVDNPVFEEVKVHATVTLKPGKDPGLYLARLREDLIRYLSPWRFDPRYDLHFGASLHSSELINYMDELGYIDYVNAVSLQLWIRDDNGALHQLTAPLDEVHAHTAASVLISSDSHDITLNETSDPCKKS